MASKRKDVKEFEKWGTCANKYVTDKEEGIQCDLCEVWFHAGCIDVTDELYKVMGCHEALHWFCPKCNGSFKKVINSIVKLELKSDRLQGHLGEVKSGIKACEEYCERECSTIKTWFTRNCNDWKIAEKRLEVAIEAKLMDMVDEKLNNKVDLEWTMWEKMWMTAWLHLNKKSKLKWKMQLVKSWV